MPSIFVVAFVVSCNQQLLLCHDIDTRRLVFDDMANCQAKLSQVVSRYQKQEGATQKVLGRCRYLLVEPSALRQMNVVDDTDSDPTRTQTSPLM